MDDKKHKELMDMFFGVLKVWAALILLFLTVMVGFAAYTAIIEAFKL